MDLLWTTEIPDVRHAFLPPMTARPNPTFANSVVYLSTLSPGGLVALDAEGGTIRWRFAPGGLGSALTTVAGDQVLWKNGHSLYALESETGHTRWQVSPHGSSAETTYSGVTVHDNLVMFGDRRGNVHCVRLQTGALEWTTQISTVKNNHVNATGRMFGDLFLTCCNEGRAVALDPTSGRIVWQTLLDSPSVHEVLAVGPKAVVGTCDSVYWIEPTTGHRVHRWGDGREVRHIDAHGDHVVVSTHGETIVRKAHPPIDVETDEWLYGLLDGVSQWTTRVEAFTMGMHIEQPGLIVGNQYGLSEVFRADNGSRMGSLLKDETHEHVSVGPLVNDVFYAAYTAGPLGRGTTFVCAGRSPFDASL